MLLPDPNRENGAGRSTTPLEQDDRKLEMALNDSKWISDWTIFQSENHCRCLRLTQLYYAIWDWSGPRPRVSGGCTRSSKGTGGISGCTSPRGARVCQKFWGCRRQQGYYLPPLLGVEWRGINHDPHWARLRTGVVDEAHAPLAFPNPGKDGLDCHSRPDTRIVLVALMGMQWGYGWEWAGLGCACW